ncbi:hypothetical protein [Zavarzinella formosa]|uniref:hypothetical protein n=1 Tax=Zavarzinella formosa TaxID=360055 RepID=UPI0002E8F4FC|nr:hypothetical protein [Zavarzinella formosa]
MPPENNQRKELESTADLPTSGHRNADPITNAPGSHPLETGIGAAIGGAATGLAIGLVGGPVGAIVGTVAGAVAGGYAGKGVGELIDPTTEDNWLRDSFAGKHYVMSGETFETYVPAYNYGAEAEARNAGKTFGELEEDLRDKWERDHRIGAMEWTHARDAVKDSYERTCELRKARERAAEAANMFTPM